MSSKIIKKEKDSSVPVQSMSTRVVRPREFRRAVHPPQGGETRCKPHEGWETDINAIVSKYMKTGRFDHVNPMQPRYGDFSEMESLKDAMDRVDLAWSQFESLPPDVRDLAEGNPAKLLELLADEQGCFDLQEAGLEFASAIPDPQSSSVAESSPQDPPAVADPGTSSPVPTDPVVSE